MKMIKNFYILPSLILEFDWSYQILFIFALNTKIDVGNRLDLVNPKVQIVGYVQLFVERD